MATSDDPADPREIVSSRVFDAPRELVFRALTDPTHLARWWGPAGFTCTVHEHDPRPGGVWRHTLHGPDGADYHNECEFVEVAPPGRLVFRHGKPVHHFTMTITLADLGGRTEMTWRLRFDSAEECDRARAVVTTGNEQNFDRLAAVLADDAAGVFTVTREFAARPALLFRVWTEAAHLGHWFGPKGCTLTVAANDPRPGGVMHYKMASPGGEMWGRWAYRELTPPDRLVFVASFSDPAGAVTRAPFNPDWPLEVLSTVTFTARGDRTVLRMRAEPVNATAAERAAFAGFHGSMRQGWAGTLEQLETHLAGVN